MKNFDFRIYQRADSLEILPLNERAEEVLERRHGWREIGYWAINTTPAELAILRSAGFTFC